MKTTRTIALAVVAGVSLSGCQMLFGQRTAKVDSANGTELAGSEIAGNPALEQGKQLLRAGRTAQAIELLRVAQRDPSSMADASNTLGVAYAKLGRHDLADRYFRMAMAMEPGDTRYAANMLRLQRDHRLALRRNEEAEQLALRAAEEKRMAEVQLAKPGQIERISRGEVTIQTGTTPQSVAPKMEVFAMRREVKRDRTGIQIDTSAMESAAGNDKVERGGSQRSVTVDVARGANSASSKSVMAPARSSDKQYPVRVYIGA